MSVAKAFSAGANIERSNLPSFCGQVKHLRYTVGIPRNGHQNSCHFYLGLLGLHF